MKRDQLPQIVFLHRLGQADLRSQRPSVRTQAIGSADEFGIFNPRPDLAYLAVRDANGNHLVVGQQALIHRL